MILVLLLLLLLLIIILIIMNDDNRVAGQAAPRVRQPTEDAARRGAGYCTILYYIIV